MNSINHLVIIYIKMAERYRSLFHPFLLFLSREAKANLLHVGDILGGP